MGVLAYYMNLSAVLEPQGSFKGRSNVFPKRTSSAEMGRRNLPMYSNTVNVAGQARGVADLNKRNIHTLYLYAPRYAFPILAVKVFVRQHIPLIVWKVFNMSDYLPLKGVRDDVMRYTRVDRDGHESV